MDRFIPSGSMPDCQECGECFENWDRILSGLYKLFLIGVRKLQVIYNVPLRNIQNVQPSKKLICRFLI